MIRGNLDTQRDTRDEHAHRDNYVKRQKEGGHLQAKDRGLRRNQTCQHSDLGLSAFRTMRKYISVI